MLKALPFFFSVALLLAGVSAGQAQDADAGEAVFKKCKSCHQIGAGAKHRSGPILTGVVGRAAASAEGYKYRKDILAASDKGLVWDEAYLSEYLDNPTDFLRRYLDNPKARSAMSYKLKNEQDRRDVIAYLASVPTGQPEASASEETTDAPAAPKKSIEEVIAAQTFSEEFLASAENFEAGKEIWFDQCTHCHGYKAYPGKAPKLKPAKYTPEFVFKRVYKGFKKMPAWHEVYSVDEIRQIVAYVKAPGFSP
ncbi:c-type cytochrome [Marimonas arenosa]|uniref:C-type cytochrome n=2 Tax=Pseudomonadati TaxID=3379134 RepID=A0AAE4B608_9RHOB|nr:c-type cytochrome [Marimonas arenosa]MDQ2090844.1 c-type cytochrome [Marimonas arenosa]